MIHYLVLMMGLILTSIAGYFSVVGLATIFSGAFWSVIIMASGLEVSKVVATSWLYRNWRITPLLIRCYMLSSIIILIGITSIGVFGYLSKAHLEVTINAQGSNAIRITQIEQQIRIAEEKIVDAKATKQILDADIKTLQSYDRIRGPEGAIAVRQGQQDQRNALDKIIFDAQERIAVSQEALVPLKTVQLNQEAEIGPLKYIAELIYGEEAKDHFDVAVRWIIIILVCVFDPLAIVMILAGNVGLSYKEEETEEFAITDKNVLNMNREGHNVT